MSVATAERTIGGTNLDAILATMADQCEAEGIAIDGEAGGAVHQWVLENVAMNPGQEFFAVFLLTGELADREARREGFLDQCDRAARRAFGK